MLRSLGAMLRMFVQPGEVYPLIRERAPLLGPMILVGAVGVVSSLAVLPYVQDLAQQQLAADPNVPAEAAAFAGTVAVWSAVVGGAVGPILYAVITAAVIAVAMLFTGGRLPYRQALSLALTAYGPLLLSSLLVAVLVSAGMVGIPTGAETTAAVFLGRDAAGTWPYRLLSLIDPFKWWHIGLLAGGIRYLGDTTPRAAWVMAGLVWVLMYASVAILVSPPAM